MVLTILGAAVGVGLTIALPAAALPPVRELIAAPISADLLMMRLASRLTVTCATF
jgi:hypothetical protein